MLDLIVLDDSTQRGVRDGLDILKAVGGLYIPGDRVAEVESLVSRAKADKLFPEDPHEGELKWSPGRGLWMRDGLRGLERAEFQLGLTGALADLGCEVVIAVHHGDVPRALVWRDALRMAHDVFGEKRTTGLVVTDRPSDGEEKLFLDECFQSTITLAPHPRLRGLALAPSTTDSAYVGLVQLADMVVGAALSTIGGRNERSEVAIFESLKRLMPVPRNDTPRGGRRLRLEPWNDLANLYHWLLDDEVAVVGSTVMRLPNEGLPYYTSPNSP